MEPWKKICTYVSIYAILREFRPIDPFYIQYLTTLPEKYTVQTIREKVYPVGIYYSVLFVVVIFLVTDYLRYKPILILNGLSGIISYSLLIGSPSIVALQAGQVFQMLFRAAEVAYIAYMFAKIKNKDHYQNANSKVRTSVMIGKSSCGIISQVLISYDLVSYTYLLYLSIIGMVLTMIWSMIIPSVKFSSYFYKDKVSVINSITVTIKDMDRPMISELNTGNLDKTNTNVQENCIRMSYTEIIQKLWTDFKISYLDANLLKWSVWWSMSLCGYVLVAQYIQLQWHTILMHEQNIKLMNGIVESLSTLLSASAAYLVGVVKYDWDKNGDLIITMVAMGLGVILFFHAYTESLMMSYIYYIIFNCIYQTMFTISSVQVAKCLKRDCYALVFGFNKLISYILITIFTVIVVEDTYFSFNIRQQFKGFMKEILVKTKNDAISQKEKNEVWTRIESLHNDTSVNQRTVQQLQSCYDNLKTRTRKELSEARVENCKMGDGINLSKVSNITELISASLKQQFTPLQNAYDSRAEFFNDIQQ